MLWSLAEIAGGGVDAGRNSADCDDGCCKTCAFIGLLDITM